MNEVTRSFYSVYTGGSLTLYITSEHSQWDRNFLTLSNSALACSPSLLSRLITCLGLSTMTEGLEEGN